MGMNPITKIEYNKSIQTKNKIKNSKTRPFHRKKEIENVCCILAIGKINPLLH